MTWWTYSFLHKKKNTQEQQWVHLGRRITGSSEEEELQAINKREGNQEASENLVGWD